MELKYNEDTGCVFCHSKAIDKISKAPFSDLICTSCGAVYYSFEETRDKAGLFTGRTVSLPNEELYKFKKG